MELNKMITTMAKTADLAQAMKFTKSLEQISPVLASTFKVAWCAYQAKEDWAEIMIR